MNYIRELNAFYDWLETNGLSLSAFALWHVLMHIANKAAWTDEFAVAVSVLCAKTGLSPRAVYEARNELKTKGRLEWRSRKGNQSAVYRLIPLSASYADNYADKDLSAINAGNHADNRADNRADKCADNGAPLNKLNKTKQGINIITPLSPQLEHSPDDQCSSLENAGLTGLTEPTNEEHSIRSDQCSKKRKQPKKPDKPEKIKYAEFVHMAADEYNTLLAKLGSEDRVRRCIEILDNYKGASGKKYKSDFRAILTWVIDRLEEEEQKKQKVVNINNASSSANTGKPKSKYVIPDGFYWS
ncbi:MAG: helix-turn-helix domain-containing protein [Peptococcaceae bacterium]|nr:helix-turn-helix domain-containing protein [Peptococcaceae bacterium]